MKINEIVFTWLFCPCHIQAPLGVPSICDFVISTFWFASQVIVCSLPLLKATAIVRINKAIRALRISIFFFLKREASFTFSKTVISSLEEEGKQSTERGKKVYSLQFFESFVFFLAQKWKGSEMTSNLKSNSKSISGNNSLVRSEVLSNLSRVIISSEFP